MKSTLSVLLMASVLFLGGCTAMTGQTAGQNVDDATTTASVKTALAADKLGKVFDPFYSTKATGTGLGLAITRQILEDHDGTVRVASSPGRGARVTLVLPPRPEEPEASGP